MKVLLAWKQQTRFQVNCCVHLKVPHLTILTPTAIIFMVQVLPVLCNFKMTYIYQMDMHLWASTMLDGITLEALLRTAEDHMYLCMHSQHQPHHHPTMMHTIKTCCDMGRIHLYNITRWVQATTIQHKNVCTKAIMTLHHTIWSICVSNLHSQAVFRWGEMLC